MIKDLEMSKIFKLQDFYSNAFSSHVSFSHLIFLYGYHAGYLYSLFELSALSVGDYEILQEYLKKKYEEIAKEYGGE